MSILRMRRRLRSGCLGGLCLFGLGRGPFLGVCVRGWKGWKGLKVGYECREVGGLSGVGWRWERKTYLLSLRQGSNLLYRCAC